MTKSTKRNVIVSAVLAIVMCMSLMVGGTFAIFTSGSKVNIAVTSGKVDVEATISEFAVYSPTSISMEESNSIIDDSNAATSVTTVNNVTSGTFANGGTATLKGGEVTLDKMTPGDKVTFTIKVENKSNVIVKYRTKVTVSDKGLYGALTVTIGEKTFDRKIITEYETLAVGKHGNDVPVKVEMPSSVGNEYQGLSCTLNFVVEAVQGNAVGESDSYPVYPTGVNDDSFTDGNIAYVEDGDVKYGKTLKDVVENTTASVIYCKAGSNIESKDTYFESHAEFNRDLTIYGNGATFNTDLSVNGITTEVKLNIYDANNLAIWGSAIKTGATLNLYEEGCTFTGKSRVTNQVFLLYTKGQETEDGNQGTLNATFKDCKAANAQFGYSTSSQGKTTFENCVFVNCGIGVKTKLKTTKSGTREDTIKDCVFVNCGISSSENASFAGYAAPISYSNDNGEGGFNGALTLNVSGCEFYNTIGDNGDILLGDTRNGEQFKSMTLNLVTVDPVSVRTAFDKLGSYTTDKIECPEHG